MIRALLNPNQDDDIIACDVNPKNIPLLYCPGCKTELVAKLGKIKTWHFAHKIAECDYGAGETELHRACKMDIYKYLLTNPRVTKAKPERSISKIGLPSIRPDISFRLDDKYAIAIEIQHSKISETTILERIENYNKHNIHVLWIIPDELDITVKERNISKFECSLKKYNYGNTFYWNKNEPGSFFKVKFENATAKITPGKSFEYYTQSAEHITGIYPDRVYYYKKLKKLTIEKIDFESFKTVVTKPFNEIPSIKIFSPYIEPIVKQKTIFKPIDTKDILK